MSKVAILRTSPSKVIKDYSRLMMLVEHQKALHKDNRTILKLNLSWTLYFPACSTAPWQLEGVLSALKEDGYKDLLAVENQTVVTHPWKGAYYNKWLPLLKRYDVKFQPLTDVEWVHYEPKAEMLAMDKLFSDILLPKTFFGSNILHLPTIKTHGHTTTTGAMKNAFGGLIPKYRHHAHLRIHDVLVDLLSIQKEIHQGLFAVMDGCIAGDGAGPRTMNPRIGNLIMASSDMVAIDAISSKIMGFNPLSLDYIRMAHDRGLGTGDLDQIEIVGMDRAEFDKLNFHFETKKSPIIKWDQNLRQKTHSVNWLHNILFRSSVFNIFIFASEFYHDRLWYPFIGAKRINAIRNSGWGRLFEKYDLGEPPEYYEVKDWNPY